MMMVLLMMRGLVFTQIKEIDQKIRDLLFGSIASGSILTASYFIYAIKENVEVQLYLVLLIYLVL